MHTNTALHLPERFHWNPRQLADAIPRRLHTLFAFDAIAAGHGAAANTGRLRRKASASYLAASPLPARFRIG